MRCERKGRSRIKRSECCSIIKLSNPIVPCSSQIWLLRHFAVLPWRRNLGQPTAKRGQSPTTPHVHFPRDVSPPPPLPPNQQKSGEHNKSTADMTASMEKDKTRLKYWPSALSGQTIHIPDLQGLFTARATPWPQVVCPYLEDVEREMEGLINTPGLVDDEKTRKGLIKAGLGGFICWLVLLISKSWRDINTDMESSCFPTAPLPALLLATRYILWLFLRDDQVDGSASATPTDASPLTRELTYLNAILLKPRTTTKAPGAPDPISALMGDFVSQLPASISMDERTRFMASITEYVGACVEEARCRNEGRVPSEERFWGFRTGNSSAGVLVILGRLVLLLFVCCSFHFSLRSGPVPVEEAL